MVRKLLSLGLVIVLAGCAKPPGETTTTTTTTTTTEPPPKPDPPKKDNNDKGVRNDVERKHIRETMDAIDKDEHP